VDGCTDAIEAIDCAVAAYVGSLEGNDGNNDPAGDYGKGPYALGDKRCRNFKTCGPTRDGDAKDLTAAVNIQVLSLFAGASHAAWVGDGKLIEVYLRLISNKSIIPLLQGTLRYYYLLSEKKVGLEPSQHWISMSVREAPSPSGPCPSCGRAPAGEPRRRKRRPRSVEASRVPLLFNTKTFAFPLSATTGALELPATRSGLSTTVVLLQNPVPRPVTMKIMDLIMSVPSQRNPARHNASSSLESPESRIGIS